MLGLIHHFPMRNDCNLISIAPISEELAWGIEFESQIWTKLHLIGYHCNGTPDDNGHILKTIRINGCIKYLCYAASGCGQLFGSFSDCTFREINTRESITTGLFLTAHVLTCPTITGNGNILAAPEGGNIISRYSMNGNLIQSSRPLEEYHIWNISECSMSQSIAVTCYGVIVILDQNLIETYNHTWETNWMYSPKDILHSVSTVFAFGNLIVGHCDQEKISIIPRNGLVTGEHPWAIYGIPFVREMKIVDDTLWVRCDDYDQTIFVFRMYQ